MQSRSTWTVSEGSGRLFWLIQKSMYGTQYPWQTIPYFQCDETGGSLNVARKAVTTKRPEMLLSSPASEEIRMWQVLQGAMQVMPLLAHFSFSRHLVSLNVQAGITQIIWNHNYRFGLYQWRCFPRMASDFQKHRFIFWSRIYILMICP